MILNANYLTATQIITSSDDPYASDAIVNVP